MKLTPQERSISLHNEFEKFMYSEGVQTWDTEYRFASPRRWRFDYAWPEFMFAVELDGIFGFDVKGNQIIGGHRTVDAFLKNAEKFEKALQLGWRVYRVPSIWIFRGRRRIWRQEVVQIINQYTQTDTE